MSRLSQFAKEVSLLRNEIVKGIPDGEDIEVTLTSEQMAFIIYCLGVAWLSEAISRLEGYQAVVETIGKVSSELLSADLAPEVDDAINRILGAAEGEGEAA